MKTLRRILIVLTPLLLSLTAINLVLYFFDDQIQKFILDNIQRLSAEHLPVEMKANSFSYSFFPPHIELEEVEIAIKDRTALGVDIISADSLSASLDVIQLLGGHLEVSNINADGIDFQMNLDLIQKPSAANAHTDMKSTLEALFRNFNLIPIQHIEFSNFNSEINSESRAIRANVRDSKFFIIRRRDTIILETEMLLQNLKMEGLSDSAYLTSGIILTPHGLEVRDFQLSTFGSDIRLQGKIDKIANFPHIDGEVNLQIKSNLDTLGGKLAEKFENFPKLNGSINSHLILKIDGLELPTAKVEFNADHILVNDRDAGNIDIRGSFAKKTFVASSFQITNEASVINLNNLKLSLQENENGPSLFVKTEVETDLLDLNELLIRVKVGDIPLELIAAGKFNCEGPLYPQFELACGGKAEGSALEVRTGEEAQQTVISLKDYQAVGDVKINKERVWYKANITIDENKGESEGTINFKQGFDITYSTPNINLVSVGKLGGLKIEGHAKLNGRTWGDRYHGQFYIDVDGKDIFLQDFLLGNAKGRVQYESGELSFKNMNSSIGASHYSAEIKADLRNHLIQIEGVSRQADAADIKNAFSRKANLPFEITGSTQVFLKASGPISLSQLSYDLSTSISHGTLMNETFDQMEVKLHAENGLMKSEKMILLKGKGSILGHAEVKPTGETNLTLEGSNFQLEESENISKLGANISGLVHFKATVNGPILSPDISLSTQVNSLFIEEQEFPNSTGNIKFNRKAAEGSLNLFAGKLRTDFVLPYSDNDPFKFRASARDWNFTSLSTLIGGGFLISEYQASLTGDLDFASTTGSWKNATGKGSIEKLLLKRADLELTNPGPMEISMDQGRLGLKNFRVSGGDSYVEAMTNRSSVDNLDLRLRGRLQIKLLQFFVPFIEELNGLAVFQTQIGGRLEKPEMYGGASLSDGYVKIRAFPHAFERIQTSAQFSQSKIIISEINSTVAGGTLTGDGNINILGLKNTPTFIKMKIQGATFNLPDHVRTSGVADLSLTGSWFPFVLAGSYHVQSGISDKEFGEDSLFSSAKQSSFLPKIILQSAFEPIHLDLQILIEKPIEIRNKIFDGSISGGVQVRGPPNFPIIIGKLYSDKNTKILFNDKPFEVTTGSISFNNPKELNPEIYFAARARVGDYDVNMLTQGSAKTPIIRFTSQPPLSQQDIIYLLAIGTTSNNVDKATTSSQQRDQSQNITNQAIAAIVQTAAKNISKSSNFDIQISSQYDDTKNVSVQRVTIGYKISDKFSVAATRQKTDLQTQEYKLKYSINPNVSASVAMEQRDNTPSSTTIDSQRQGQVLGIDLEFKREFK